MGRGDLNFSCTIIFTTCLKQIKKQTSLFVVHTMIQKEPCNVHDNCVGNRCLIADYAQLLSESTCNAEIFSTATSTSFFSICNKFASQNIRMMMMSLRDLLINLAKNINLSLDDVHIHENTLIKRFNEQRLLAKELLDKNCVNLGNDIQMDMKLFLSILISLKLTAVVTVEQLKFYYLPYALPKVIHHGDPYEYLIGEPLLIKFSSGYFPLEVFHSLVMHFLENLPKNWKHLFDDATSKQYCDMITFCVSDEFFLHLHAKFSYLEVQFRYYEKYDDISQMPFFSVFCYLRECIETFCLNVEIQYGFLCNGNYSHLDQHDHMVHLQSVQLPLPDYLICDSSPSCKTLLGEAHKLWFTEVCYVCVINDFACCCITAN